MNICNPFAANPMMQGANPFEAWQKLWLQGLNTMQVQAPAKQDLPQVGDMFGQFNAMQNMWLNAFNPQQPSQVTPTAPYGIQAPKITVTTIELGDMRPYMEMASNMMNAFQSFGAPMMNAWSRK